MNSIIWRVCKALDWIDARRPTKEFPPFASKGDAVSAVKKWMESEGVHCVIATQERGYFRTEYESVSVHSGDPDLIWERFVVPYKDGKPFCGKSLGRAQDGEFESSAYQDKTVRVGDRKREDIRPVVGELWGLKKKKVLDACPELIGGAYVQSHQRRENTSTAIHRENVGSGATPL